MSQAISELCVLLIEDNFGGLFSHIFSCLLLHGRLSIGRIVHHTGLPGKHVKHGLAVLIQQHLIFHYSSLDDPITYYEANTKAAYYLARSGKILELVRERLGDYAATVVSTLLSLGHAKVSHLETLRELKPTASRKGQGKQKPNGVNGTHSSETSEPIVNGGSDHSFHSKLHATLRSLAAHGYIMRVMEAQFRSPADNFYDAEKVVKSRPEVRELKGTKLQEAIDDGVRQLVKDRTDGAIFSGWMSNGPPRGIKRRAAPTEIGPNKRAKLHDGIREDDDDDEFSDDNDFDETVPMDGNMVIRINYDKFDVAFRNRRLVKLAEQNISPVTSQVYETLLSRIEHQTPRCRDQEELIPEGEEAEQYSAPIPLQAICEDLDPQLDLVGSIAGGNYTNGTGRRGGQDDDSEDDDEHDNGEDDEEGGNRIIELQPHLSLLAQEPYVFSTRRLQSGTVTWTVEYRRLARKLRHLELERLIGSRFGGSALRLIRVLLAKGKLDEKRLQEISLMASKDLRQLLSLLEGAGFIDLQEVPRDSQRQPSRTLYLWFYDPDRVRMAVIEDTYKAMSRCLRRIQVERGKLKHFLEKTERSDVKGNEERYLSDAELEVLKQWRDKEALLLGEVSRLDDLVAVLRDY
ncbi:RNA polymerase III subunit C82 [Arachnomyces sp. PD_36]|nr:RNA polymerase III subunit C82 [Arachnomyces sp. PD_36]